MTHSQRKGAGGERELARILRDGLSGEFPEGFFYVERTGNAQADGSQKFDLELPKLGIEVKRAKVAKDYQIQKWWEQTTAQSVANQMIGVLAYRQDQQLWRIVVPGTHVDQDGRLQIHSFLELTETLYLPGFFRWYLLYNKAMTRKVTINGEEHATHIA